MGTIKQVTYNLIGSSSNNGYDIYKDLLSQKHSSNAEQYYISKIGIQAPPGSVFAFNADAEGSEIPIVMGKTGIYELEGVRIYKFKFLKQYELQQDEEATNTYRVAAQRHLAMADYFFDNYVLRDHENEGNLQTDIAKQAAQLEIYMYGGENSPTLYYKPSYNSENNLIGFYIKDQEEEGYTGEKYVGLEKAKEELIIGNRGIYVRPKEANIIDVSNVIIDYVEEGVE